MANKLCCEVNPCYFCEACRFVECNDCWNETSNVAIYKDPSRYHFSEYGSSSATYRPNYSRSISWGICRVTGTKVWSSSSKPTNLWLISESQAKNEASKE